MAQQPKPQELQIRLPDEEMQQYIKFMKENERLGENLQKVESQLEAELVNRRTKFITRKEVMTYSEEVPIYRTVGKAFILDTVKNTEESLRQDLGKSDQKILQIKKTGIYIMGQQDGVRMQISELVKPFISK